MSDFTRIPTRRSSATQFQPTSPTVDEEDDQVAPLKPRSLMRGSSSVNLADKAYHETEEGMYVWTVSDGCGGVVESFTFPALLA